MVMPERFKQSDYVGFIKELVPELQTAKNALNLGSPKRVPSLKSILLMDDTKIQGMVNMKDLHSIYTSADALELEKRESKIYFEDVTNIQFTSGTTGYPKGASLTHFGILNNAYFLGENLKVTPDDKIVVSVPLYHCFGMVIGNLVCVNYGATQVYPCEGFDPKMALEAVTKYNGTAIYGVPTMFVAYLEEYSKNKEKYDLSNLTKGYCAGSICPDVLMDRIINELGIKDLLNCYG